VALNAVQGKDIELPTHEEEASFSVERMQGVCTDLESLGEKHAADFLRTALAAEGPKPDLESLDQDAIERAIKRLTKLRFQS